MLLLAPASLLQLETTNPVPHIRSSYLFLLPVEHPTIRILEPLDAVQVVKRLLAIHYNFAAMLKMTRL
jgi:hypothetical protein